MGEIIGKLLGGVLDHKQFQEFSSKKVFDSFEGPTNDCVFVRVCVCELVNVILGEQTKQSELREQENGDLKNRELSNKKQPGGVTEGFGREHQGVQTMEGVE